MNTKTNTSVAAPKEKLMEDLQLVVADAEELLRASANLAGEGTATAHGRIQKSLQVVKERLVDAEAAVIERTRQAAKVTDQYVHDNLWNWY